MVAKEDLNQSIAIKIGVSRIRELFFWPVLQCSCIKILSIVIDDVTKLRRFKHGRFFRTRDIFGKKKQIYLCNFTIPKFSNVSNEL